MQIRSCFPENLLKGQRVFVTGGGSGINLAIARNFAAVGADIGICGRTQEKLDAAAEELQQLGVRVYRQTADVRNFEALRAAVDGAAEDLGGIDVMVAAAAGNFICPAEALSPNGFKAVMDIDLLGSFHASKAALPHMKAGGGNLIFISAGMAMQPYFAQAHVGAAKAGVDNLMRTLALEWGPYGIRSNSIIPGPIENTEGMRRLAPGEVGQRLRDQIPLRRFGTVDEIAQVAVFLASPMASYVTGTAIVVDGGQNLPGSGPFEQAIRETMQAAQS